MEDETYLKIDHSTPTTAPVGQAPANLNTEQTPVTPEPNQKPKKEKKLKLNFPKVNFKFKLNLSKKSIILISAISGAIILAAISVLFFVTSNKPAPSPTDTNTNEPTTTTTTTTTSPEPTEEPYIQEDTQISEEMKTLVVALTQFQNNNRGKVPANWDTFFENYAQELGQKYKYKTCDFMNFDCKNISELTWEEDAGTVYIASNSSCKSSYIVRQEDSVRRITFYTVLHAKHSGRPAYFCASNETWYN